MILGDAPVDSAVLLLLAVHHAKEEERAAGQQHPVRLGVPGRRLHGLAILVPLDLRLRLALGLAVQRHRLVLRDNYIRGVLRYSRGSELS